MNAIPYRERKEVEAELQGKWRAREERGCHPQSGSSVSAKYQKRLTFAIRSDAARMRTTS